jgi:enamine deaminase RidA (YjgF/YER057c/UK114 family)
VLTSGQLPWRNKIMLYPGRLGGEVSVEDGYQAARQAGLNAIAQLKSATGGDLERIRRIVRLEGYVYCAPGFRDHPKILDGASDLLLEVFEERGKHVSIALEIPDMPLNACVQLGVWAEVSDYRHRVRRSLHSPDYAPFLGHKSSTMRRLQVGRLRACSLEMPETTSCPE